MYVNLAYVYRAAVEDKEDDKRRVQYVLRIDRRHMLDLCYEPFTYTAVTAI
jgi:hypothetical protein